MIGYISGPFMSFLFILVAIFALCRPVRTCVSIFMHILTLLSHLLGYAKLVYTIFTSQSRAMVFCVCSDCLHFQNCEFVSQGFPQ
jgi:hypothetical protein